MRVPVKLVVSLTALSIAASGAATPQPVSLTGTTTAEGELLQDVAKNIIQFAPAFDCTIATSIKANRLDPVSIPARAGYRLPYKDVTYEEWVADFCGQSVPFLVKLRPDPAGGTFILIDYPYPAGAPHATR